MLHTLRRSPCVNHPCLEMFNNLLRKGIDTICNLSLTDIQWLKASLPVKDGGLGVRRVSSLASSVFLASAAATNTLQQQLLFRSSITGTTDASVSMVIHGQGHVVVSLHHRLLYLPSSNQSTWDRAVTALERQMVINSLSNATDKARLLSVTSPHSSDWLHALPLSGCGLRLATSLLDFDREQTYASLTSALAERLLTQEDCMVYRAEGATVAPQGITA